MILVLPSGTYVRFDSVRTGETLLEARHLDGALIVYGAANRDHYDIGLTGEDVCITGTLWDRRGPAVSFGENELRFQARVLVDTGAMPSEYDGAWTRDDS